MAVVLLSSRLCILTCLPFHPLLLMMRPSQPMPPPVQTGYRRRLVGPSRLSPDPHDCAFFGPKGAAVLAGRWVGVPFVYITPLPLHGWLLPVCVCPFSIQVLAEACDLHPPMCSLI